MTIILESWLPEWVVNCRSAEEAFQAKQSGPAGRVSLLPPFGTAGLMVS
jgi:hypothetical protein